MLESLWENPGCVDGLCREVFIGLPRFMHTGFYIAAGIMIAVFVMASYMRIQVWLSGIDDEDAPELKGVTTIGILYQSFTKLFSKECFFAYRVKTQNVVRQWALMITMWTFYILVFGTAAVAIDYDFFYGSLLTGSVWQVFSLVLDVSGAFLMVAVTFFLLRRFVFTPERIVGNFEDAAIMILLLLVCVSAFVLEGSRLAIQDFPNHWSPVGNLFGTVISFLFAGNKTLLQWFYMPAWGAHVLLSFAFILYIPFSKQFHMFATQITTANVAVRDKYRAGLMYED